MLALRARPGFKACTHHKHSALASIRVPAESIGF